MLSHFQISLIEKAGHDHGFEYSITSSPSEVVLGSALHASAIAITPSESGGFRVLIKSGPQSLFAELSRSFKVDLLAGFQLATEAELAQWMRRAAALARALPNQTLVNYEEQVASELAKLSDADLSGTEVQRLVRQRVGQQAYRAGMMNYWAGECAVTGVTVAAALRASHAKPWAECVSDSERLDVFNGFLLSANLDALFDKFLITFSDSGRLLISSRVSEHDKKALGLDESMSLRWIASEHLVYLKHHQNEFYKAN